jgi:hypothetical protein
MHRGHKFKVGASKRAFNCAPQELSPQTIGLAVVHDEGIANQLATDAEGKFIFTTGHFLCD